MVVRKWNCKYKTSEGLALGYFVCSGSVRDRLQFIVLRLGPQLEYELSYYCEQGFSLPKMMATPT